MVRQIDAGSPWSRPSFFLLHFYRCRNDWGIDTVNRVGVGMQRTSNPNCNGPVPLNVPSVNPYSVIFSATTSPCGVDVLNVATPAVRTRLIIFAPGLDPSKNVPTGKSHRNAASRHSLIAHALLRSPQGSAP